MNYFQRKIKIYFQLFILAFSHFLLPWQKIPSIQPYFNLIISDGFKSEKSKLVQLYVPTVQDFTIKPNKRTTTQVHRQHAIKIQISMRVLLNFHH